MGEDALVTSSQAPVILHDDNHIVFFDQLVLEWQGQPYAELAVLLVWVRALAIIHQTHHWEASGDPFYGDHLLYDRLYGETNKEIDQVAEKAVGMGTSALLCPHLQLDQVQKVMRVVYFQRPGIPQSSDLADRSLHAEQCFLKALARAIESLEARGELTAGVDNLLSEVCDRHEGHCYLLKQRRT